MIGVFILDIVFLPKISIDFKCILLIEYSLTEIKLPTFIFMYDVSEHPFLLVSTTNNSKIPLLFPHWISTKLEFIPLMIFPPLRLHSKN